QIHGREMANAPRGCVPCLRCRAWSAANTAVARCCPNEEFGRTRLVCRSRTRAPGRQGTRQFVFEASAWRLIEKNDPRRTRPKTGCAFLEAGGAAASPLF